MRNAFQVNHALVYLSIVKSLIFVLHRLGSIFDQVFIFPLWSNVSHHIVSEFKT